MIPDFGGTKSWCFVDQAYRFPDPLNPWKEAFPQIISMVNLDHNVQADFVAVKVGDLNQSASVSGLQSAELRSGETLKLSIENQQLKAGNVYEVPVTAAEMSKIAGYQFALNWNTQELELVDLKNGITKMDEIGLFTDRGLLTTSWVDQGKSKKGALFTLVFKAKGNVQLSEVLQLNRKALSAEAYNSEAGVMGLALDFGTATTALNNEMLLEQNQPNPFSTETQIGFWLPQAGEATLSIHDVTGRMVKTIRQSFDKGHHQVLVKQNDLPSNGVYYYTLTQNGATATRKMVITK